MQFPNGDLADRPTAHCHPVRQRGIPILSQDKTLSRKGKIRVSGGICGEVHSIEASNTYGEGGGTIIFRAGSDSILGDHRNFLATIS